LWSVSSRPEEEEHSYIFVIDASPNGGFVPFGRLDLLTALGMIRRCETSAIPDIHHLLSDFHPPVLPGVHREQPVSRFEAGGSSGRAEAVIALSHDGFVQSMAARRS